MLVFRLRDPRAALRWFKRRAGPAFDRDRDWLFWRGIAHYQLGALDEAARLLHASNEREDCIMWQAEQALIYRVRIAARRGDGDDARRLMTRLRELTMDPQALRAEIARDRLLRTATAARRSPASRAPSRPTRPPRARSARSRTRSEAR